MASVSFSTKNWDSLHYLNSLADVFLLERKYLKGILLPDTFKKINFFAADLHR